VWSLADAAYWTKQGLWPLAGNFLAVEDVFSTYLYTGNGSTQTITNGINLSGSGGMVWVRSRSTTNDNKLTDTARGVQKGLITNSIAAQSTDTTGLTAFNSNGFALSSDFSYNNGSQTYASWTFREAPNFFDVVTYTGNGVSGRQIAHNLGSTPGMILFKATSDTGSWLVWHRYDGTKYLELNSTNAAGSGTVSIPTSSVFTIEAAANGNWNTNGITYVAYLFAHDTASTGLIQCGAYTGNGSASGPVVTLGWEPQWLMVKNTSATSNWQIIDNMRGMPVGSADATLQANLANAESAVEYVSPTATGFQVTSTSSQVNTNTQTYIYVAIRRGPMKTPTLGTSVFAPVARTGTSAGANVTSGFVADLIFIKTRASVENWVFGDRLRGGGMYLSSNLTSADANSGAYPGGTTYFDTNNGAKLGSDSWVNSSGVTYGNFLLQRAPGFFDEVCFTATGATLTSGHNLGVVPELVITKARSAGSNWQVNYNFGATTCGEIYLNNTNVGGSYAYSLGTAVAALPTASQIQFYGFPSGQTHVAYLFASCPGVSKVGNYTGNGSSQTINCAFTTGARFVLIKRTDSTGDWYVWDSTRGIVAGNDPYLALNSTAAEVTTNDSVDTDNTGFVVNQVAASNVNVNGATYIFLAIA
jgi:hypothetical protein